MLNFFKKNRLESLLLVGILLLALFLRVYHIEGYMTFLGDEGRDVRIVRDLITKGNLVFIGPQTSIGNMYLGPLYYYLIAPSLALSFLNPVGPAIMNALIGVATVFFVWFFGKKWFSSTAGLVSSFLYAISPVAIIYSRSSWNPNPMPLFALLTLWAIYQVWQNKKYSWLMHTGLFFACALQMHYLGLLLIPTIGIFWLLTLVPLVKQKDQKQKATFLKYSLFGLLIFFVLMSPLLLFDLKHSGQNFNAFKAFFTDRQTTVNLNPARSDRFIPVIFTTVIDLITARQEFFTGLISIIVLILSICTYFFSGYKKNLQVIFVWLVFGFLGLGVYKQHVYIHYMGFIYPAVYLLLGTILAFLFQKNKITALIASLMLIFLAQINLFHSPILETPNNQLSRTEKAVDQIIKESNNEPFNFGLIAKQNYDESYRYFLENKKSKMVRGEDRVTNQLFVICEDGDKCQPEGNPAYQVAIFGPASTSAQWQIDYLKLYKLTPKK